MAIHLPGTPAPKREEGSQPAPAPEGAQPPESGAQPDTTEAMTREITDALMPIAAHLKKIFETFINQVWSYHGPVQLSVIIGIGVLCYLLRKPVIRLLVKVWPADRLILLSRVRAVLVTLVQPILWMLGLWLATTILRGQFIANDVVRLAASLLNAWILIRLFSVAVSDPFWSRTFAVCAWFVAALTALRLLDPTIAMLDSIGMTIGGTRISLYLILKGSMMAAVLLWLASTSSRVLQMRLSNSRNLTPSVQVLIGQLVRFTLLFLAVVIALNTVGIDLTALAVFSGAVGVGLGFGLQKIVSNLISGIILLMDRSIKPGDVVEVGGTYGWVSSLGARYTAVRTRDGTEHLIPNEEFIVSRVVNWTHSDKVVRRKVQVGVSYSADLDQVIELMKQAAKDVPRILAQPKPNILVKGFGDSSIDLEARIWINDPANGVANVASEYMLAVWRTFRDNNIEIPFPQRDLHIRSGLPSLPDDGTAAEAEQAVAKADG